VRSAGRTWARYVLPAPLGCTLVKPAAGVLEGRMYHYDAKIALEELQEEALLPHPVKLRDMILRTKLGPQDAQLLNHDFQEYLTRFGELQRTARNVLEKLAAGQPKTA
jgi:hypothetical protein